MIFATQATFRIAILGCAIIVGLQAIWMTLPTMSAALLKKSATSGTAVGPNAAANWAARLGIVRGDLWAEVALTYGGFDWTRGRVDAGADTRESAEAARALVERALSRSPHDARLWLVLAALDGQLQRYQRAAVALKMSYYTGPNEVGLIPPRLLIAVRTGGLADEDLRQLVRHELRTIMSRKPALKPAIIAAYREADPAARRLIEEVVSEQDPKLLASLRSEHGVR
jgi:hypothetical protein